MSVHVCVYCLALSTGRPGNSSEYPHPSLSLWLSSLYKHKMSWELCASPGPPVPFSRINLKLQASRIQLQIYAATTCLQSCRGLFLHQLSRIDPFFCQTQQTGLCARARCHSIRFVFATPCLLKILKTGTPYLVPGTNAVCFLSMSFYLQSA